MQAIITNLLLGMAENLQTPEDKVQVQKNEASPFTQILQKLQKNGELESELESVLSLKDGNEALMAFLDEVLAEMDFEMVELPVVTIPSLRDIILGNEEILGKIKKISQEEDLNGARREIKEILERSMPSEKIGSPLQLDRVPFSKMKTMNSGLAAGETKGEKTEPGKQNKEKALPGKEPEESVNLKNRAEDTEKKILFARGEQIKKPVLEEKEAIIREAVQVKKGKSSQPNIFLQVTEQGEKSIPLIREGPAFTEGEFLQTQPRMLKIQKFSPGQEKTGEATNSDPSVDKFSPQIFPRGKEEDRFDLFSGFQQEGKNRKGSFGQGNDRSTEFQFESWQNYQRSEMRPPNIETARTIDPQNRTPQVFQQIIDQARLTLRNREEGTIEIKLRPEYLGGLRMKVVLEDGQLRANFQVENHLARDILENNLTTLRDNLSREGFNFDDVDVNVQGEGSESSGQREGEFTERNPGGEDNQEAIEESLYSILGKNEVDYRV